MEAGLCDVALITYGSTQRLDRSRSRGGAAQDARMPSGQFVLPYGMLSPIGFYAMQARLHMHAMAPARRIWAKSHWRQGDGRSSIRMPWQPRH